MSISVNPSDLLTQLTKHNQLVKNVVETERVLIHLTDSTLSIATTSQSGHIISGENKISESFIVSQGLLLGVLNSLKADTEILIDLKDTTMVLDGRKKYELPIIWVSGEMTTEFYESLAYKSTVNLTKQISTPVELAAKSIVSIGGNAALKTIVAHLDKKLWIGFGGLATICLISAPSTEENSEIIASKDNIMVSLLSKLVNLDIVTLSIGEKSVGLKDEHNSISHTATIGTDPTALTRIWDLTSGKDPVTTINVNSKAIKSHIKDAMAIARADDRIPINFTATEIETKLALGSMKYEYKGTLDGYTMTGEDVSLGLPANILYSIVNAIDAMTKGGQLKIDIYANGTSKIIVTSAECEDGVKVEYIVRVMITTL